MRQFHKYSSDKLPEHKLNCGNFALENRVKRKKKDEQQMD